MTEKHELCEWPRCVVPCSCCNTAPYLKILRRCETWQLLPALPQASLVAAEVQRKQELSAAAQEQQGLRQQLADAQAAAAAGEAAQRRLQQELSAAAEEQQGLRQQLADMTAQAQQLEAQLEQASRAGTGRMQPTLFSFTSAAVRPMCPRVSGTFRNSPWFRDSPCHARPPADGGCRSGGPQPGSRAACRGAA